jgi:tetrapyrrole methylase family protein/MazG family protein
MELGMTAKKNGRVAGRRKKENKKVRKSPQKKPKNMARAEAGVWFEKLVGVMARLRAPGGCPWDREQTHASLRTYLIEEAYEVLDALDGADDVKFAEELGDLLLQIVFHAEMAEEEGRFNIVDVIREIYEKMIRRHPHVFGEKQG